MNSAIGAGKKKIKKKNLKHERPKRGHANQTNLRMFMSLGMILNHFKVK